MDKMKKADKKKWVTALRSGEYEQGASVVRQGDLYCCLGVACEVIDGKKPKNGTFYLKGGRFGLSRTLQEALGNADDGNLGYAKESLVELGYDDSPASKSFVDIADWIEVNL